MKRKRRKNRISKENKILRRKRMGLFNKIKCWFKNCDENEDIKSEVLEDIKEETLELQKELEKIQETLDNKVSNNIKKVKRHWYNNGKEQKLIPVDVEVTEEWVRGKLPKKV